MSESRSVEELSLLLERQGVAPEGSRSGLAARLDIAVRRTAGSALSRLSCWCGDRRGALAVFVLDEERRAVRQLVRGVIGSTSLEDRMSGLLPTPGLSESRLRRLAEATDLADLKVRLERIANPFALALAGIDEVEPPDLLTLETRLSRVWASRALRSVPRRSGELGRFVRRSIDLENLWTLLLLRGRDRGTRSIESLWINGGEPPDPHIVRAVLEAPDHKSAIQVLARAGLPPGWKAASRILKEDPLDWERAVLAEGISDLTRRRRLSPLGAVPLLWYLTRLRGQVVDLSRIIWGVALGVPGSILRTRLVSV